MSERSIWHAWVDRALGQGENEHAGCMEAKIKKQEKVWNHG
jgi:hypothetical protein